MKKTLSVLEIFAFKVGKNGYFFAQKSTKNGVFLLTVSEIFPLMTLYLPKMRIYMSFLD